MLSPNDILVQCQRKYPAFLRATVTGGPFFPLDIRFGRPSPTAAWATLQSEISALAQAETRVGYRIDWTEANTRQWGRQRLPARVCFQEEASYLNLLGKKEEVARFRVNVALTRTQRLTLEPWLASHASRVLEHEKQWSNLLQVCGYFAKNPRPGLYARELPIPVSTKFIEEHRPILRSLLDFILPPEAIDTTSEHFEVRFGLRFDEAQVRARFLDVSLGEELKISAHDFALPWSQFNALSWSGLTVVIVENKMNFLTLPKLPRALAVWGAGNAASLLENVGWMRDCNLYYWGDLDAHGFHILSRLRRTMPHVHSVLMDETTLERFEAYWTESAPTSYEAISGLSSAEQKTYARIKANQPPILLEQEKIFQPYAVAELSRVITGQTAI